MDAPEPLKTAKIDFRKITIPLSVALVVVFVGGGTIVAATDRLNEVQALEASVNADIRSLTHELDRTVDAVNALTQSTTELRADLSEVKGYLRGVRENANPISFSASEPSPSPEP